MAHPDNSAEIAKIRKYIQAAENELNDLGIIPRELKVYPFDSVALAKLSKAFALAKACLSLLESGFPDEAFGLVRSLVECAINLRFITAEPASQQERANDFIEYALAVKTHALYVALQQFEGRKEGQEIRAYAEQLGIAPDAKSVRRHWSGLNAFIWEVTVCEHPLDGPAVTEQHKKAANAMDYQSSSTHVHCSLPAIDNYFVAPGMSYRIGTATGDYHQPSQSTLYIILIYIHYVIAYVLFGLKIDRPASLNLLFEGALAELSPVKRLHH